MKMRVMILFWAAALAACGNPDVDKGDAGWKFGDDVGMDAGGADTGGGTDTGGTADGGVTDSGTIDGGGPGGSAVTFRMTNGGTMPVFAYQQVSGGLSCYDGAWLEVIENGETRRLTSDCTRCSCDDAPNCTVCALDCAPGANPEYNQLAAGETRTFEWNGLFQVESTRDGVTCDTQAPPTADQLTARFCWGTSFATTLAPFGEIEDIDCADVEFSPDDEIVEFTLPQIETAPVEVTMANETQQTVYANFGVGGECSFGKWVTFSNPNGQELQVVSVCGQCHCTEVGESMCPEVCPAVSCAAPTREAYELQPGEERAFSWNRVAWIDDTVDGQTCEWDRLQAGPVTAEFCWAKELDAGFQLVAPECETIEFMPFQTNSVRQVIDGA